MRERTVKMNDDGISDTFGKSTTALALSLFRLSLLLPPRNFVNENFHHARKILAPLSLRRQIPTAPEMFTERQSNPPHPCRIANRLPRKLMTRRNGRSRRRHPLNISRPPNNLPHPGGHILMIRRGRRRPIIHVNHFLFPYVIFRKLLLLQNSILSAKNLPLSSLRASSISFSLINSLPSKTVAVWAIFPTYNTGRNISFMSLTLEPSAKPPALETTKRTAKPP